MRPALACIDLAALRHNYRLAKQYHGARALAVIKADAYGHGALVCAQALSGEADGFAVACWEEALFLRESDIAAPILVLEGAFSPAEIEAAARYQVGMVFHQAEQLLMLEEARLVQPMTAWLKINTGMNRVGFNPDSACSAWVRLKSHPLVAEVVLMTHFARADEPDRDATFRQCQTFDEVVSRLPGGQCAAQSLANSAGLLAWPASRRDWGRPGIMLYGANPLLGQDETFALEPVMSLKSRVFGVRELMPGESLGYGGRFQAENRTRVGLVAMGYADGYPRSAAENTPVAVDGVLTRLIGRVSMDMLTVDLTNLPQAGVGSEVELWGRQVSVNHVAALAGTLSYELLCNVKRVKRQYVGSESTDE